MIRETIAKTKIYFERGYGLLNVIYRLIPILTLVGVYGLTIGDGFIIALALGTMCIVVGVIDLKRGFWKKEMSIQTLKVNPVFKEWDEKLQRIEKAICNKKNNR